MSIDDGTRCVAAEIFYNKKDGSTGHVKIGSASVPENVSDTEALACLFKTYIFGTDVTTKGVDYFTGEEFHTKDLFS